MYIRYYELKRIVYIMIAILGITLIAVSMIEFGKVLDLGSFLAGTVCLISGAVMVFFAVETYLLRDDPDVWM